MPLYEEKLINPLALRFTQEHIRTTFRDGRPVEPTIDEIQVLPGVGEYDVILRAPFPHIEIIRWSPPNHGRHAIDTSADDDATNAGTGSAGREYHWFTLDNRRLYCLQKVAVALLPKRAAAVVEILYADPGAVRRKYDSETQGWSVSISHSTRCAPICRWSWQEQVLPGRLVTVADIHKAHVAWQAIARDDARPTVEDLQDVDAASSAITRLGDALRHAEEAAVAETLASTSDNSNASEPAVMADLDGISSSQGHGAVEADCPTPSTTDDSESEAWSAEAPTSTDVTPRSRSTSGARSGRKSARESKSAAYATLEDDALASVRACLDGSRWVGRRGDTYELSYVGEKYWTCVRKDNSGSKKFTVSYDGEHHLVWWGTDMAFYTDASDLSREGTGQVCWYAASDWHKQKVRFAWTTTGAKTAGEGKQSQRAASGKDASALDKPQRKAGGKKSVKWW